MWCRISLILVLIATPVWPQQILRPFPGGFFRPLVSQQLREFLELTREQVQSIDQVNERFAEFQGSKTQRRFIVQTEIAQESARPTIDPMALGLRYRELTLIEREIEEERVKTRTAVQAVLTAAQRTKLGTLEQALRLQSTACSAVDSHLMAPLPGESYIFDPLTALNPLVTSALGGVCGASSWSRLGIFGLTDESPRSPVQ
jgi:Spy/CpxP family protein refolding chaperone